MDAGVRATGSRRMCAPKPSQEETTHPLLLLFTKAQNLYAFFQNAADALDARGYL